MLGPLAVFEVYFFHG